jgi:hypothetical protein
MSDTTPDTGPLPDPLEPIDPPDTEPEIDTEGMGQPDDNDG